MDSSKKKAMIYLAKAEALSTAAEMIRQHGEEGFCYKDSEFNKEYNKQKIKIAKSLNAQAEKWVQKYEELGIDIDTSVEDEDPY